MVSSFPLVTVLVGVCGLLSLMGWVGWRFFVPVTPKTNPSAAVAHIPSATAAGRKRSPGFRLPTMLYWAVILVLLVGALVVGGVFLLSDRIALEPLAALKWDRQAHIQGVFNPERLVPPPALPPTMFVGSDRPAIETADRDWSKLDPEFTQTVLRLMARLQDRGYPFALLEGYRSPERQEKLAALGSHVTSARAFQSKHQYGLAVDMAPIRDGRLVISELDPRAMEAYQALGEEAAKAGLTWGGNWWFKDFGHVEVAGAITKMARDAR